VNDAAPAGPDATSIATSASIENNNRRIMITSSLTQRETYSSRRRALNPHKQGV
jgi:hypothetical protein